MSQRATVAPGMIGFLSRRRGWWRLMLLGVILLIFGSYISPLRSYLEKSGTIQREQAATEELKREHDRLQQEKESLQDSRYLEHVARKDLGMIKPGEQPYVVKDLNNDEDPGAIDSQPAGEASLGERIMNSLGSLIP